MDLLPHNGDTYTPDLLTPQPGTGARRRDPLAEQVAQIEAATQEDLETQVLTYTRTHWSRPLRATTRRVAESGRMQRRLANGLARFWRDALSDGRPELRSITDQDIAQRATSSSRSTPPGSSSSTTPPNGSEPAVTTGPGGIAQVVGDVRAALPADLGTARSTAELAARVGYAPSTVSYHLGAPHRARLVTKVGAGRYVVYQRTAQAAHLPEEAHALHRP
ncbi:winged helix-turn-helix domain-containing protein [Saccharothrix sp. HUAS TT1]|uniref:helix-turn-helix domain-containing protein n=1 Tax=unclassified Saccharothrix TaxID=2593673 RepID=UPI00345B88D2